MRLTFLAAALLLAGPAAAQSIPISQLPVATAPNGTEKLPAVQNGRTVAVTVSQILAPAQPLDPDLTAIAALATTPTGRDLLTSADPAAIRTKAGLGTIATQNASGVSITGGSITGITDLAIADGGTGASTAALARTNLGLGTAATQNTGTTGATVPLLNAANTWSLAQTFSTPVALGSGGTGAADATTARSNLGLGTAAVKNTGTTGNTVPLLDGGNYWSTTQEFGGGRTTFTNAGATFAISHVNNTILFDMSSGLVNGLTFDSFGAKFQVRDKTGNSYAAGLSVNGLTTTIPNLVLTNALPITSGGTGAATASAALTNLGAAPLASPAFTGTPTAPTAATGVSSTQIATTAFVQAVNATTVTRLTSAFTTTSTSPVNITGLTFNAAPNSYYIIDVSATFRVDTTTSGAGFRFTGPSTFNSYTFDCVINNNQNGSGTPVFFHRRAFSTVIATTAAVDTANADMAATCHALLATDSSASPVLQLQTALASAGTLTILPGATIVVRQVP